MTVARYMSGEQYRAVAVSRKNTDMMITGTGTTMMEAINACIANLAEFHGKDIQWAGPKDKCGCGKMWGHTGKHAPV